jgi:trans-aconitate methyltransferase
MRNLAEADVARRSEVRVGEFMALDLDAGSFDLILLNNNLYYFAHATWGALFERIFSRLVPRGLLVIQAPVISDRAGSRMMGHTANTAAFDLYLRAHNNLYGLPDLALLHTVLRKTGFETVAETAFLHGGAARYLWARAPAE